MTQRCCYNLIALLIVYLILNIFFVYSLAYCESGSMTTGDGKYLCNGEYQILTINSQDDTLQYYWENGQCYCLSYFRYPYTNDFYILLDSQPISYAACPACTFARYSFNNCSEITPLDNLQSEFNGTCPNSAVYCHVGGKKCQQRNCSIAVWQDANGRCGNVVTTQCSAEDIQYCDENNLWITEVRSCITGSSSEEFQQALQDLWSSKCCYSYTDWSNRDEIKNMKYYMVDYDPSKDKPIPDTQYNADNSSIVVNSGGGITGSAQVQNATTSDLADYLAAIQANTAAIAANLEKLSLTGGMTTGSGIGFGAGSGSGSGSGSGGVSGSINGSGSGNMTIDWGQGEVQALTQEDFNTDIDVPGDIEAMGNATYGQGVTDVIENLPIISALRSSGVEIQNSQCSITGTIYGHEIHIDFCNDTITNMLQLMGTIIYGVSIFVFFFIVFTF